MIGWTIGGRVHWKSSARKVTKHLNLRVPMGSGFKQVLEKWKLISACLVKRGLKKLFLGH
jgi:hypothetical protein